MYRNPRKRSSSYANKPYKKPRAAIVASARPKYMRVQGRSAGALVASPENKYYDTTFPATAMAATAASWASTEMDPATKLTLCCPVQGTGISDRVGRKIHVTKLKLRGTVGYSVAGSLSSVSSMPEVRILIVQDLQTNGAQLNGEDVMASSATAAVANQILTYQNLANFGRFKVLKDKQLDFKTGIAANNASATTISQELSSISFKCTLKFRKPVVVHFNSTNGGTVADIVDNSFHVLALGSNTSCTLAYECRVVFVDV